MDCYEHTHEAVRVKVKKCEANVPPDWRKFSVDPQITTLEVLYSLLAKAFDTKSDFSIKYKAFDPAGNEIYLSVLSDWDLDAAFLRIHNLSIQTATEPCLILQIDIKPHTETKNCDALTPTSAATTPTGRSKMNEDLLVNTSVGVKIPVSVNSIPPSIGAREIMTPLQQSIGVSQKYVQHMQTKLPGLIMNQMEKTFSMVQKAFNLTEETISPIPPRPPLADNEFRQFLDALGQIQRTDELRKVIFFGGIEPSLRRVVWKHILNVYPGVMNGHQRMEYMRQKSEHYYRLRETWKTAVKNGCVVGELAYVTSMVKKDVLRTDRLHKFYAGNDDNQNIASLFNILTTYALNHPSVSYCQGMSDIASPLLVTMNDEAQAYICFCALMLRLRGNFMLDGIAMTQKFAHLTEALSFYDPEFWEYLKKQQADDLLFCYRWLLLELKREFPFEDALRMLEVQWSSLKYDANKNKDLKLFEKEFVPMSEKSIAASGNSHLNSLISTNTHSPSYLFSKSRESPYTKVCALRRQSSSASLSSLSSSLCSNSNLSNIDARKLDITKRLNQSLDDNISRNVVTRRQRPTKHGKSHQSLDESKIATLIKELDKSSNTSERDSNLNVCEDIDDEVFSEDKTIGDGDGDVDVDGDDDNNAEYFQFHPTNPFKEDAAQTSLAPSQHALETNKSCVAEDEIQAEQKSNKTSPLLSTSIANLQHKNILSNYNAVSNIIAKQLANASNVSEAMKRVASGSSGGHFKELKEKIAATSRAGFSFDESSDNSNEYNQQKLVKNFNEFLNFTSVSKNRASDRQTDPTANTGNLLAHKVSPYATTTLSISPSQSYSLTKKSFSAQHQTMSATAINAKPSSFDESDSTSSIPDVTWSNSTAATAIQQGNNLSNSHNSLHLELSSHSSLPNFTPDRSPAAFSPLKYSPTVESPKVIGVAGNTDDVSMTATLSMPGCDVRLEAENLMKQVLSGQCQRSRTTTIDSSSEIEYEKLGKYSQDSASDLTNLSESGTSSRIHTDQSLNCATRRQSDESKAIAGKYRLEFDDDDDGTDGNSGDFQVDASSSSKATIQAPQLTYSNPFIDDDQQQMDSIENHSTSVPNMADSLIGIPYSSSFPEVLVPVSTDDDDDELLVPNAPIELATNATDITDLALSSSKNQANGNYSNVYQYSNSKSTDSLVKKTNPQQSTASSSLTALPPRSITPPSLPPPTEFAGGNPFLMFLCLTLLLQHRNTIMKNNMDYNEIAMHFDKMVRKHDVTRVLNQARRMYIDYLKIQNAYKQRLQANNTKSTKDLHNSKLTNDNLNADSSSSSTVR